MRVIMKQIGITTTIPSEVLIAAGYKVIDMNNLFIASSDYLKYIDLAEKEGFPKNTCAWIKGLYGACLKNDIKELVGVVGGDCSNTLALAEVLKSRGIKIFPFSYPYSHSLSDVKHSISTFIDTFGVTEGEVENTRNRLNEVRRLARRIDELTYLDNKASGFENHLYQVTLSDFDGSISGCESMLKAKVSEIEQRTPRAGEIRLGYMGVPPMTCDLYEYVENFGARVVYNEVQREFAFPRAEAAKNIYEQYHDYTYPYDIHFRLEEIKKQITIRKLDAILHYTQAFCHRGIEDILVKQELKIPILTIEGDKQNTLDSRTKLRLEAFLDMLSDQKGANA